MFLVIRFRIAPLCRSTGRFLTFALLLILVGSRCADAGEIERFDRLGRSNVTLKVVQLAGGSKVAGQNIKTNYGTYSKEIETRKEFEIAIPLLGGHTELAVEAYAISKDRSDKTMRAERLEVTQDAGGKFRFEISGGHTRERWMYADAGRVTEYGEKNLGWLVRAIAANQIVGVAGSSPQFETLAGEPGKLSALIRPAAGR